MIEVSMFIWGSPLFWKYNAELKAKLLESKSYPFRSDDMIHLILDIMKIRTDSYDSTRSPISTDYNKNRPRIYNGKVYIKDATS